MDSFKVIAIASLALLGTPVVAAENNNPVQGALMLTSVAPFLLVSGATALTSAIPEQFKSSKSDALAFIGSGGEIRGARFEQASRFYRSTYNTPLMSDMQLAQAIATAF
ncbi:MULTISPECIES: DUF2388 domain-containing protein [Pseudomonas fluorescens group]|uniref:Holliday junction resolvase n=3 Tax=Pseudomonas fluorescens group TaxID=136843 RepID=A0A3M4AVR5_PSEMA|nr:MULTISPECIES: DUF2388 domain-containing protein [Pseudomonas fluorescens group]MCD7037854.1 DUF2388 domain-containing protein [Pseudomonas petroselini]MCD7047123.1 DUF2388 domain-containing protein [Pseudomonas petroselini]MCD7067848.1 DUF2388 domain-containing protein [Pseudomonas petroselini]MCD7078726.1 DUF2388 domain-containing protein [Pseudomonas petroselini]MCF5664696.1 DUF2388 domain-containing protein [Pseudomonas marginalis]